MREGKCHGCGKEDWINWGPKGTGEFCAECFDERGYGESSGNIAVPRRMKIKQEAMKRNKLSDLSPPKDKRIRSKKYRVDDDEE